MALNFSISKGLIPAPQIVTPATVVRKSGHANALAFTLPIIKPDLTTVHFKQRKSAGVLEFTFDRGTMGITLRQEVYMANDLTPCAQRKWAAHERHHVDDNRDCMDAMDTEIMRYSFCSSLFQAGDWYPSSDFSLIQGHLAQEIGDAFRDLTLKKVHAIDTKAEYSRVAREILRDCPGPIIYTVMAGDNLSLIAQHYYGTQSKSDKIYRANESVIGKNRHHLRIGLKLTIPK